MWHVAVLLRRAAQFDWGGGATPAVLSPWIKSPRQVLVAFAVCLSRAPVSIRHVLVQ